MPVPGYDPDDLDEMLEQRLSRREVSDYLTDEEVDRWESGESLLDLLDDDDVHRLVEKIED